MDAITALTAQHRVIEGLFEDVARGLGRRARSSSFSRLAEELIAHLAAEEAVLYPSVRQALLGDARERSEGRDERLLLLRMELRRAIEASMGDSFFGDRINVLQTLFMQHVHEQEAELFPRVVREVSEAARAVLGAEILASRPALWTVTTEGRGLPHAGDEWARSRVSLLLS